MPTTLALPTTVYTVSHVCCRFTSSFYIAQVGPVLHLPKSIILKLQTRMDIKDEEAQTYIHCTHHTPLYCMHTHYLKLLKISL